MNKKREMLRALPRAHLLPSLPDLGVHVAFLIKKELSMVLKQLHSIILFEGVIFYYHLIASYVPELLQIFNKSLLAKFCWAMDVDPDFRF